MANWCRKRAWPELVIGKSQGGEGTGMGLGCRLNEVSPCVPSEGPRGLGRSRYSLTMGSGVGGGTAVIYL